MMMQINDTLVDIIWLQIIRNENLSYNVCQSILMMWNFRSTGIDCIDTLTNRCI